MRGYKVLTHDLRSPIQGGKPLWDGTLPYTLPPVTVDMSNRECATGWNFTKTIEAGLSVVGLWPNGRPSRVFVVEADDPVIVRKDKCRAATLTIMQEVDEKEIITAIGRLSSPFRMWADEMIAEQVAWRRALSRPCCDEAVVVESLERALCTRGLTSWRLKRFDTAWDVWNAKVARVMWDAGTTWDSGIFWNDWAGWGVDTIWNSKPIWEATIPWDVMAAWDAKNALMLWFASRQGWTKFSHDFLTTGLRDAYSNGLAVVISMSEETLAYAMVGKTR